MGGIFNNVKHLESIDGNRTWVPTGGKGGTYPIPYTWNLKKKHDVICCRPTKYPWALVIDTLYFSLKRRKNFRLRLRCAKKVVDCLYGTPKMCQVFMVLVDLPSLPHEIGHSF